MRKELLIATGATVGVGASVFVAQVFFDIPHMSTSQGDSIPSATNSGKVFRGPSVDVRYGRVRVEITVLDGKITHARALESPAFRSTQYSRYAIPVLIQQTLVAQSADIQGASGASFTSYGWKSSLQSAINAAKL